MPLVACYILPKYKEVEEGLSKSSVEFSSNYKLHVSCPEDSRMGAGREVSVPDSRQTP